MLLLIYSLIVGMVVLYCLFKYFSHKKAEINRKKTENEPQYVELVTEMKVLVVFVQSTPEHYLTISERKAIKNRIDNVLKEILKYNINKNFYGYPEYYVLKTLQVDINTKLNKLNKAFIEKELKQYKELFDNIDGKSLDKQQRMAIVMDESHNLVVAGAGSGKTLTILGKVLYLLKCGVLPEEILLIAFTRKAAGELEERINRNFDFKINVATFHKLGLDIITQNNNERPDIEENMSTFIEDFFSKELINNEEDMQLFLEFIGCYFNIPIELKTDGTLGEKIENEHSADLETLSEKYNNFIAPEKKTIKGENVRSIEELIIANFLFLNGVNYEYEKEYKFPPEAQIDKFKKRYRPDFYLKDYNIYLEHFGIDKNNRCPWLSPVEEQKYIDDMAWKKEAHKTYGTKLIETYSYFQSEGTLLIKLKQLLLSNNVELKSISIENMIPFVKELQFENTIREFRKLCETFISLFKTNSYNKQYFEVLKKKFSNINNMKDINQFFTMRTLSFIKIIEKIYLYYQSRLTEKNSIDFSDMINKAVEIVKKHSIKEKYKYIIIDEYQDIGMDRYRLIKAVIEKTSAHLMCVGDDWQSIYRFAGSDADLLMRFENYWGQSQISKIENTYRNSQELINIASSFIMKNEKQIRKTLRSEKSINNPICIYYYNENNFISVIQNAIKDIVKEFGEETNILILGRTKYDIEMLRQKEFVDPFIIKGSNIIYKRYKNLKIEFLTVHKAKGLQADNVIILNMKNDKLGFPNKIADDPILQIVLPAEDSFAFAEERRLFYVALTRTKNKAHILVPDCNASCFANEIESLCHLEIPYGENLIINNPKCPKCKTGRLLIRQSSENKNYFVGCSNFPACDFTSKDTSIIKNPIQCKNCGGFMVMREGPYEKFLGCTNYPICKNKVKIN